MKKNNKVYSMSDFAGAKSLTLVADCLWTINNVYATKEGSVSHTPLFVVELTRFDVPNTTGLPEGFIDASREMEPNRTYFVREGRPLYNDLMSLYDNFDSCEEFSYYAVSKYRNKVYRGRVERLSNVVYDYTNSRGTVCHRTKMEAWYPSSFDEGCICDDFITMCNRGVYVPVIEEKKDPLEGFDPAVVAAVMAAIGKK
jgi:hypothetical protein